MKDKKEFHSILERIAGSSYEEYAQVSGDFDFSRYTLKITGIEAPGTPTLVLLKVPQIIAAFPPQLFDSPVRRTALEDLLTRKLNEGIRALPQYHVDGGTRRHLSIAAPGQKILPRTSLVITEEYVEARIYVDLPVLRDPGQRGGGQCIDFDAMYGIFFEDLPAVVNAALIYCNLPEGEAEEFVDVMEDADRVRQQLGAQGQVAFVGSDSRLGRKTGTDLPDPACPRLDIPYELSTGMDVPRAGQVRGLCIPRGLTLIIGDGYSGRVELLKALAGGIYNHVPGDGREFMLTVPDAVYIAAESARPVQRVDISGFVRRMSNGSTPERFSSAIADPCAAQAAATMEALEAGARVLIYDESDSSPGFLSSDSRLNPLLSRGDGSIDSLALRARQLVDELGISLIVGGLSCAAEFIPIADTVLSVEGYRITDVTVEAGRMELPPPPGGNPSPSVSAMTEKSRWIVPTSIDPSHGTTDDLIEAPTTNHLRFGRSEIDLRAVTQLADRYQTLTIGHILYYAKLRYMDEGRSMREILDLVDRDLSSEGLECLTPRGLNGQLARPRRYEIAAALNRLDTLRISHTGT